MKPTVTHSGNHPKGMNRPQIGLLDPHDEAQLTAYGPALAHFERSTEGTKLELAELYAHAGATCGACHGAGTLIKLDDDEQFEAMVDCPHCGTTGLITWKIDYDDRPELTARPDPTKRPIDPRHPNEAALFLCGSVSRKLARVSPQARIVLEVYYGDPGAKWGAGLNCPQCLGAGRHKNDHELPCPRCRGAGHIGRSRYGRLFSLFALTKAGRKLVRENQGHADIPIDEALHNLIEASQLKEVSQRNPLIALADRQAQTALELACKEWRDRT